MRPRSLLRNKDGSAAVEFAFVSGAMILLLLGSMQLGLYLYVSASLDYATSRAMRQVRTGAVSSSSLTAAQFRTNVLCPLLPSMMPCSNIVTNIQTVPQAASPNGFYTFVNANQSGILPPTMNNNLTSFCTGSTGSVVYAQIYYAMPLLLLSLFKFPAATWNGQSVFFVGSAAAFKNEPFQGGIGNC